MSVSLINGPLRLGVRKLSPLHGGTADNSFAPTQRGPSSSSPAAASDHRAMAGESSDDEGPEEVSLQSGRDAAAQQRSQEKEVTQKSRCVPPSRLAQVALHAHTQHQRSQPGEERQEGGYGEGAQDRQRCAQVAALPIGVAVAAPCCGLGSAVSAEAGS